MVRTSSSTCPASARAASEWQPFCVRPFSSVRPSWRPSCRPSSPRPSAAFFGAPSWRPSSSARPSWRPCFFGGSLLGSLLAPPFSWRGLLRRTHRQRLGARHLDTGVFSAHLVKLLLKRLLVVAWSSSGRPCSRPRKAPAIPWKVPADQFHRAGDRIGAASTCRIELPPASDVHPTYPARGLPSPRAMAAHIQTNVAKDAARRIACRQFRQAPHNESPTTGFDRLASPGRGGGPWTVLLLSGGPHRLLGSIANRVAGTPNSLFRIAERAVNKKQRSCRANTKKNALPDRDSARMPRERLQSIRVGVVSNEFGTVDQ